MVVDWTTKGFKNLPNSSQLIMVRGQTGKWHYATNSYSPSCGTKATIYKVLRVWHVWGKEIKGNTCIHCQRPINDHLRANMLAFSNLFAPASLENWYIE